MATYLVTFRIENKTVGARTYGERYQALVKAVREATTGRTWDEPTSFYAIQSTYSIEDVAAHLAKAIARAEDLVLVLDAEVKTGRVAGHVKDSNLFLVLPFVKAI